jgi:hypothetical protein
MQQCYNVFLRASGAQFGPCSGAKFGSLEPRNESYLENRFTDEKFNGRVINDTIKIVAGLRREPIAGGIAPRHRVTEPKLYYLSLQSVVWLRERLCDA